VGGELDAPQLNVQQMGLDCIAIGPFDLNGEEWGFRLCLHQYRFQVGLLGINFSTDILAYLAMAAVIIGWGVIKYLLPVS
jgi:hypothetical protein